MGLLGTSSILVFVLRKIIYYNFANYLHNMQQTLFVCVDIAAFSPSCRFPNSIGLTVPVSSAHVWFLYRLIVECLSLATKICHRLIVECLWLATKICHRHRCQTLQVAFVSTFSCAPISADSLSRALSPFSSCRYRGGCCFVHALLHL